METTDIASICKALSDANRLKIVQTLSGCEKCAYVILDELSISQPTLSHHMKILRDCGLVNVRKDGKWCYYSLNCDTLRIFQHFIASLNCTPIGNVADKKCC